MNRTLSGLKGRRYALFIVAALGILFFAGCSASDSPPEPPEPPVPPPYFPPIGSAVWQTATPSSLGWNTADIPDFLSFLEANGTRAFLVLKGGKIVMEEYFGTNLAGSGPFEATSVWYWASVGKTLVAATVGIAQNEGHLTINDRSSDHLGSGWTSLTPSQEDAISVRHQLTMTTGLDDGVAESHSTLPQDLIYKAAAGTRWAYHNAPYTLLEQVVTNAAGEDFEAYFNRLVRDEIGMDGAWFWNGYDHIYYSTARSMARWGLLVLHDGAWDGSVILKNAGYVADMLSSSQTLNPSYGYLWWLNGKASYMIPESQTVFPGPHAPNAPADMVSGIGMYGQYVCVIPSKDLVMVRFGENTYSMPMLFSFLDDIWARLKLIVK